MGDLAKELHELADDIVSPKGKTMDRWDQIRHQVETRKGSDLPRMNFEGLMEDHAEKFREAADEIERLREALQRADYCINRLDAAYRGHVVRDLDEAYNAWESYKARVTYDMHALAADCCDPEFNRALLEAADEIERLRAWAEDEQRGRHKAEEQRTEARSEVWRLRQSLEQSVNLSGESLTAFVNETLAYEQLTQQEDK